MTLIDSNNEPIFLNYQLTTNPSKPYILAYYLDLLLTSSSTEVFTYKVDKTFTFSNNFFHYTTCTHRSPFTFNPLVDSLILIRFTLVTPTLPFIVKLALVYSWSRPLYPSANCIFFRLSSFVICWLVLSASSFICICFLDLVCAVPFFYNSETLNQLSSSVCTNISMVFSV
jgi:hypothetical protein